MVKLMVLLNDNYNDLDEGEWNLLNTMKYKILEMLPSMMEKMNKAENPPQNNEVQNSILEYSWKRFAELGEKIPAIKVYRVLTGFGLKDSKDDVEFYMEHRYVRPTNNI